MYVVSSINLSTTQITKVVDAESWKQRAAVKNTCTGKTTPGSYLSKHFTVALALREASYTEKLPKSISSNQYYEQKKTNKQNLTENIQVAKQEMNEVIIYKSVLLMLILFKRHIDDTFDV